MKSEQLPAILLLDSKEYLVETRTRARLLGAEFIQIFQFCAYLVLIYRYCTTRNLFFVSERDILSSIFHRWEIHSIKIKLSVKAGIFGLLIVND